MTGAVIVIFLAIVFVWAVLGPTYTPPPTRERIPQNKISEKQTTGPPNVVNHTPKRKAAIPHEDDRTLPTDTYLRMMGKKNNVRFN